MSLLKKDRRGMRVLSLFDKTANMVKPWAKAGFICYCVDIQHPKGETREGNIIKIGADVRDVFSWLPRQIDEIVIAFAFPPCTHLAVSGARWMRQKGLRALNEAIELFDVTVKLFEWLGCPYMIENPVSTISTYWRKPDYIFQPWQYGDLYYKKTCLWTGNGFIMPEPVYDTPPEGTEPKIWKLPPSLDRSDKRSETPVNFAKAVFEANCDVVKRIEER